MVIFVWGKKRILLFRALGGSIARQPSSPRCKVNHTDVFFSRLWMCETVCHRCPAKVFVPLLNWVQQRTREIETENTLALPLHLPNVHALAQRLISSPSPLSLMSCLQHKTTRSGLKSNHRPLQSPSRRACTSAEQKQAL